MIRTFLACFVAVSLLATIPAHAQTGNGNLTGYVKDEQGGIMPGVTMTATSEALFAPIVAVTDSSAGYYRLNNLPPGTYVVTAELPGFATYRREGILVRAGSTFSIDVEMKVSSLSETVTVAGESPMIETSKPGTVFTIQGDLLRAAPITSRRLFSDLLDMAPGVESRNVNDGVGRRAYYFHGASIFSHVFMLEGAPASSYLDAAAHSMGMGGDTIADSELKLGGVDAASPSGTGVVMNIIAPRGGSVFKGSAVYSFQPRAWNADNTIGGSHPGGIPTVQSVNQPDLSLGGPLVKNKTWFFVAFRYAHLTNGISRTPFNVASLSAFNPSFTPFDNTVGSKQPFVKVTSQLSSKHELSGFYQRDRLIYTSDRELNASKFTYNSTGGGLTQVKLTSVWNNHLTSQISAVYNNKSGNDAKTFADLQIVGPQIIVHQDAFTSAGTMVGTGGIAQLNNPQSLAISPASMLVFRGDLTYFKEGWAGSHEFRTGFWAEPRATRNTTAQYVNNGAYLQEVRQVDPTNPAAGTTLFHYAYKSPSTVPTISTQDRDIAIYVQDSWKPHPRVTADVGIRIDWVRRRDLIWNVDRMNNHGVGPRVGVSYLVTADARNVLHASYSRMYEQMNGRDYITTFGQTTTTTTTDVYIDKTGKQTTIVTPPSSALLATQQFDPNLHQPYVDEFVVGYRKQFPGQVSVELSGTHRSLHDGYAWYDINGFYPSGPNQPFGGFGRVDPNRGIVQFETNRTWAPVIVNAVEAVVAKNMSHNFQMMLSASRQWDHVDGTWNPTDPARFIQPDAFPDDKDLTNYLWGNGESNLLNGTGVVTGAAFRPFNVRVAGQYFAPWGLSLAGSYVIMAGDYVGTVVTRIAAPDPRFGSPTVTLANGTTQPNPLATTIRFAFPTRSDGQTLNETVRYLQLKIGRVFKRGRHTFEPALNVFNVFNTGAYSQWLDNGANQVYNPNYLAVFNRHPPRAFQLNVAYRF